MLMLRDVCLSLCRAFAGVMRVAGDILEGVHAFTYLLHRVRGQGRRTTFAYKRHNLINI